MAHCSINRVRVLLADDHPLTLEGIRLFLDSRVENVGTVTDGRALVDAALRLKPDLIILDITMPLLNGIDAAIQIKKSLPTVKFLFVTMHVNPAYLQAALAAGASGYVVKSAAREELLDAIQAVMNGQLFVSPNLPGEELAFRNKPSQAVAALRLSSREREILQLIAEGRAQKEIAHVLSISVKTVAFHKGNVRRKLGLKSTAELTKHAIEQGLI